MEELVARLARARIGSTYNQYADSALRRERLARYLESRGDAPILLVGEAPGYRGTRVSGIPLTSERQLTGAGPAEATATIVHRVLGELGLEDDVLLWNVVPTHPGTETANRRPTRSEVEAGEPFLAELAQSRSVVAVGRLAHRRLGGPYVRHPSHGGASAFRLGLMVALSLDETISATWRASHGRPEEVADRPSAGGAPATTRAGPGTTPRGRTARCRRRS